MTLIENTVEGYVKLREQLNAQELERTKLAAGEYLTARGETRARLALELGELTAPRRIDLERLLPTDDEKCERCGSRVCEGCERPPLRFRVAGELMLEPRPAEIIAGVAWAGCCSVVVSESGAGKTFVLMDVGAAVGAGQPWHGRAVRRGSVACVSFEGDALGLRLVALRDAGIPLEDFHVVRATDPLSPRVGRDGVEAISFGEVALAGALAELAARLERETRPPIVLVIIDTIRASLAGSEDSSEHVSAYLRTVRRLSAPFPSAAVILAHHSGWQDSTEQRRRRERGSSALRGNVDATLYLEVVGDAPEEHGAYLELTALKVRDGERPAPLRLLRRQVELLHSDGAGDPLTSCVIERDPRSREDREAAAAAEAQAENEALDRKVLETVRDHAPTSQGAIRELVGCGRDKVHPAVARLTGRRLIDRANQRSPFRLTVGGLEALE